jgi:hypothetical protein
MHELALKNPKRLCRILGCSGMDSKCPGNAECQIIQRALEERPDLVEIANDY